MAARRKPRGESAKVSDTSIEDLGEPIPHNDLGMVSENAEIESSTAKRLTALDPESAAKAAKAKHANKAELKDAKWGRAVGPGDWDDTVTWLRNKAILDGAILYLRTIDPPGDLPPVQARQVPTGAKFYEYLASRHARPDAMVKIEWRVYAGGSQRRVGEMTLYPVTEEEEEVEITPSYGGGYGYPQQPPPWAQQPHVPPWQRPPQQPWNPYGQQWPQPPAAAAVAWHAAWHAARDASATA